MSDKNKISSSVDIVTIRFAGDSGDGMQLTGTQFTTNTAIFPTSFFLKGRNKNTSNKPPNRPHTNIAKKHEIAKFRPKGENFSKNNTL